MRHSATCGLRPHYSFDQPLRLHELALEESDTNSYFHDVVFNERKEISGKYTTTMSPDLINLYSLTLTIDDSHRIELTRSISTYMFAIPGKVNSQDLGLHPKPQFYGKGKQLGPCPRSNRFTLKAIK